MSCDDGSCGTGGWGGPKPGDPSNNGVLTATPAFGGIDLNWSFPTTNPFAVAHTRVYRGIIPDFNGAIVIKDPVGGSFYYDKVPPITLYFYWIQFVSINGTYGEVIGPVSAVAKSSIEETMLQLTGMINEGMLAQALKGQLSAIPALDGRIFQEIADRLASNQVLSAALDAVSSDLGVALTYVQNEITERRDGDAALVDSINVLAAGMGGSNAALEEEKLVRATKDTALASDITTLYAQTGGNAAAIQTTNQAIVTQAAATTSQINTSQATMNGNLAGVQTALQTNINTVNGKVTSIGALYTVKLNANGLVGGFGAYNDGTTIQAGFDVDTFWVGRTNGAKTYPFMISGGVTYINDAAINKLTFDKLRAADGSVIISNGKLQAAYLEADNIVAKNIDVSSGVAGSPTTHMTNGLTQVFYANGQLAVRMGIW